MDRTEDLSFQSYAKMGPSSDGPNPLRPYYKAPSIGLPEPSPNQSGPASPPLAPRRFGGNSSHDFRELFSDLDYGDYLPRTSPSVAEMAKGLVDKTIWNYSSTILAQPFEVAKIILQTHDAGNIAQSNGPAETRGYFAREQEFEYSESDSDSDAPSYFVPTTPDETPTRKVFRKHTPSRTHSTNSSGNIPSSQIPTLSLSRSDSIIEVISQEWSKEGAFGVWKGTNSTFIYGILLKTIETWTRSFLSALLNIPDPTLGVVRSINGPNILDSPSPIISISVVVISAGIAGFILSPIDIIRTRLIITPVSNGPRALIPSLRALPSLSCPPALLPITILHSTVPSLVSTSLPLCLRTWLSIDPILTPAAHSISSFFVSLVEIFVKLPLETVLRRGHVATLLNPPQATPSGRKLGSPLLPLHTTGISPRIRTIVPVGPYKGIIGTLLYIANEEGTRPSSQPSTPRTTSSQSLRGRQLESRRVHQTQERRGQGLKGVIRGWRFGFWALIGVYATAGLSASGQQEF